MAPDFVALALGQLFAFFLAFVIRNHGFAPKRLAAAQLVAQTGFLRGAIKHALRSADVPDADVDDLVQDVIAEAWQASEADRYCPDPEKPPRRALQSWLRGIAAHHVLHHLDLARFRREELTEDPPDAPASAPGADLVLEGVDERRLLRAALAELPADFRAVVVAHDVDELDMENIAQQIGRPVSTVYKWRMRGIAALMKDRRLRRR